MTELVCFSLKINGVFQAEKRLWHPAGFTSVSTTTQLFVNNGASTRQSLGKRANHEALAPLLVCIAVILARSLIETTFKQTIRPHVDHNARATVLRNSFFHQEHRSSGCLLQLSCLSVNASHTHFVERVEPGRGCDFSGSFLCQGRLICSKLGRF
jgi:hypothetical protein